MASTTAPTDPRRNCIDVDKATVTRLFAEALGYDYLVDPTSCSTRFVRKSNLNAMHDGIVCTHPASHLPVMSINALINNSDGDGLG
jgi:hypothetical protein